MLTLTQKQIDRQDFVDNAIFDVIQQVNPTNKKLKWNIELIGEVRDGIENVSVDRLGFCNKKTFYPFIKFKSQDKK